MIPIIIAAVLAYLAYRLQLEFYKRHWKDGLLVDFDFGRTIMTAGDKSELVEVVENRKRLPLSILDVKFQTDKKLIFADSSFTQVTDQYYRNDVFKISGGEKITRTIPFTASSRGYFTITGADIISSDLLMKASFNDRLPIERFLYVYPKKYKNSELDDVLRQINGDVSSKRNLTEDPFEFIGIREYQQFDSMNAINWKATARSGELMVNSKGYTNFPFVRVFMNVEDSSVFKRGDSVELGFSIAASVCDFFINRGIGVEVFSNGRDIIDGSVVRINKGNGGGHLENILRTLARVDLVNKKVADFTQEFVNELTDESGALLTVIISANAYDDFTSMLYEYGKENDYIWLYPVCGVMTLELPEKCIDNIRVIHEDK